ncbi:MAG: rhomboid family intramembrane serine protease, partial [Bacteroidetes bacterium]
MPPVTDTVKHLLIINILLYFGTLLVLGDPDPGLMMQLIQEPSPDHFWEWKRYMLALFTPGSSYFQPFQIVTHMFMHGNITHLFFNMFGIYMFGPPLEMYWGPKRFLTYYFVAGFGAMALHLLVMYLQLKGHAVDPMSVNVPMLGASGALFGLLAGFAMKFPEQRILLLIPPIPIRAKYFVAIYAAIELYLGLG